MPRRLNEENVLSIINGIWNHSQEDKIVIDFSPLVFALPFGALLLTSELSYHYETTSKPITIIGYNNYNPAHSYLAHIGFFKLASFNLGKVPGEAVGSANYIPIRIIEKSYFEKLNRELLADRGLTKPLGEFIKEESYELAKLIVDSIDHDSILSVAYCFREIIRNVFEHSKTSKCLFCAQRYANGIVEVAIADKGCGIFQSIRHKYLVRSHKEALAQAILPGITAGSMGKEEGDWENTGYGLYVLSELGKQHGKFTICSGDSSITCTNSKTQSQSHLFQGTAVQLRLSIQNNNINENVIDSIVKKGEELAGMHGGIKKASKVSQSLF